jgi:hypothetical protein
MEVLVSSESYGWARRKVGEANIILSHYPDEARDGNALLVSSLAGAREALMYLQTGSPRESYDIHILRAGGQISSDYERLLSYIDGTIEIAGRFEERSTALYGLVSALVSTVSDLVDAAGDLWSLEKPKSN